MTIHSVADMASDAYTEAWLVGPQATKFYTRTYLAPPSESRAVLVFIHGFAEHVGRYTWAHPQFAQRGINVFTFDQRGFGKTALDTENKSKSSSYGKTSGEDQMDDIKWALKHAVESFPGLPLFLMGHSMGGGEVLNFPVRRRKDAESMLSGVIACSGLVLQAKPSSKLARAAGGFASIFIPYLTIPAPLDFNDLSHDAVYNEIAKKDPLAKLQGTLRGISDMLNWGDLLHSVNHKHWPRTLPILFVHGSGDQITSHEAAENFHNNIECDDKAIIFYDGAFHELVQEPDHREKLLKDQFAFIEAHLSRPAPVPVEAKL
ncbi:lysophospholipase [Mycena vitilis]|nr:lysophospholipase [Mycena vitilis]